MNKTFLIGLGCMLVGAISVVWGCLTIPVIAIVKIVVGGAVGFVGYKIFSSPEAKKPSGLDYGND